jgi:hypothetical protein
MQRIEQPTTEQVMRRRANLERKRKQRAREKARSHQAMVDHLERIKGDKMNAEGIIRRTQRNQCMFGETAPGIDARTLEEALEVAREMAHALTVSDVQDGESLHNFERRVFDAWTNYEGFRGGNNSCDGGGAPHLNRRTGELSPGRGKLYWQEYCGGFDQCWTALLGAKKTLDLAALPKLKKLKRPEKPKLEPKPAQALTPAPPIPQQQPDAINFAWIPPDAQRYLHGGRS